MPKRLDDWPRHDRHACLSIHSGRLEHVEDILMGLLGTHRAENGVVAADERLSSGMDNFAVDQDLLHLITDSLRITDLSLQLFFEHIQSAVLSRLRGK